VAISAGAIGQGGPDLEPCAPGDTEAAGAAAADAASLFAAATAAHQRQDWEAAAQLYAAVLARAPRHAESLHRLGVVAQQLGRADAAVAAIGAAIALDPGHAAWHRDLGHALRRQGRAEAAAAAYRRSLALEPGQPETLHCLGNVLRGLGDLPAAAACYRRVLALRPHTPEAHINLGNTLRDQGRLAAAAAEYQAALRLQPDNAVTYSNLGAVQDEQDEQAAAEASYRAALRLQPDLAQALGNLGNTLRRQGRLEEAIACLRRAVAVQPGDADAHFHLGMALLAQGAYAEGWPEMEWRWQTPQMRHAQPRRERPAWRGEPIAGQTLLLQTEQGFGDTLQFCRFAPLAAAASGARVVLEAPGALVRLLRSLPGVAEVVPCGATLPAFDRQCLLMSLPLALGTTLATLPAPRQYLHADPVRLAAWRARLAGRETAGTAPRPLRVGLAWAGNPLPEAPHLAAMDRRRSIPPALLAPLHAVPGVALFSLQKAGPAAPADWRIADHMGEMADFADTAALVANLDLVISVDTAIVHLAAALGRPVWLLDRFDPCWRWLTGRRDSPWYPGLCIYRQPRAGDWDTVIAAAAADLRALALKGGTPDGDAAASGPGYDGAAAPAPGLPTGTAGGVRESAIS
jgi:tetratricopeptide (TPR) repeat protein